MIKTQWWREIKADPIRHEQYKAQQRAYRLREGSARERRLAAKKAYAHLHPSKTNNRKKRYGLTRDAYEELLDTQKRSCVICGSPSTELFVVDHSHSTGRVRGILCRKCNCGIGMFNDNPELIRQAADYCERHADLLQLVS